MTTNNKLSEARKKEWVDPVMRAKRITSMKGRKVRQSTRKKLSLKHKGKNFSPETQFKKGHKGFKNKGNFEKGHVPWNKGKTAKEDERIPNKEDHHSWKGGVTSKNEKIRKSAKYKQWRKKVFEKDNYTCKKCGQKGSKLQADHIKPFSLFPELRFKLNNGRTLCKKCYQQTDTYAGKMKTYEITNKETL